MTTALVAPVTWMAAARELIALTSRFTQLGSLDEIVEVVRTGARALLRADGITFIVREGDQVHYIGEDAIGPLWLGRRFALRDCLSGVALLEHKALIIEDIYRDPRVPIELYEETFVKSVLMVPIRRADPLGAIGVYWARRHAATDAEQEIAQTLADATAGALARLQAQAEFLQSQKMEIVGRMAAGVSHDFNNLLVGIFGFVDLLQRRTDLPEEARAWIEEIRLTSLRARSLSRQLLIVSRREQPVPQRIDLNRIVNELEPLLRRTLDHELEFVLSLADEPTFVYADPSQIGQVIMNLAVNARDALSGQSGRVELHTEKRQARSEAASAVERADHVLLSVRDSGTGMTPEVQARVFEPFFTTKPVGQGTGLGLSTAHDLVQQAGGVLRVQSKLGQGTRFEILLPVAPPERARAPNHAAPLRKPQRGHETVLVVDDEASVRKVVGLVLHEAGYHVLEAEHGLQAIELASSGEQPIDLLLSDLVMPHMDGLRLVEWFRKHQPRTRSVLMSGYLGDAATRRHVADDQATLLEKPFLPSDLLDAVRKALDDDA